MEILFGILLLVAIALIFARLLGHVFDRLNQPPVIGEILAGIILGGIVVLFFSEQNFFLFDQKLLLPNLNHFKSEGFFILSEIGLLLLLFISGLETRVSHLKKTGKASIFVAIGGVVIPLTLGILAGIYFNLPTSGCIALGLILTATSVGITVRTLMDLHVLNTDSGATILGGAFIDDILGIILLAFVMSVETLTLDTIPSLAWVGMKIAIFFLIFLFIGLKVIDKILDLGEKIHLPKAFLSISLSILLIYSFFADKAGISGIIGAFVAGLLIGHTVKSRKITKDVKTIGYGFFIPLFFVGIGASLWFDASGDLSFLTKVGLFAIVVIAIGIIGKIIGCGIGAKLAGMSNRQSLQIGTGMIPRMELALIISAAAISRGLFSIKNNLELTEEIEHMIRITTVLLIIVTTLISPFLIKAAFKKRKRITEKA